MQLKSREKVLEKLLFAGAPLISVFLIDSIVTDPVNTPKLFILGIVSSGVLGSILYGLGKIEIKRLWIPISILVTYVLLSLVTLFTSSAPLAQSVYGVYGRNNGLLTYVFFSVLYLGGIFISSLSTHLRLVQGLLIAGIINIFYCGWVIIFGDFLSWNNPYGNILGTFGNPNFIGAFLGIFFSTWLALLLGQDTTRKFRILSLFVLPLTALEIYLSHAIQGRVLMAGGTALVFYFWIKSRGKSRLILIGYSFFTLMGAGLALAGALQVGPLTSIVYKTSVSLRGQYWLSAWNTGISHPFTGVGYDSLGDWYRRMRDPHALDLPGIDTVINTAHNVPLDIFAFGGWPLFISYLGLILLTAFQAFRFSINLRQYDKVFVALTVAWACYQVQSLISINQIGLGFWGWVLSGAILSYVRLSRVNSGEYISGTRPNLKARTQTKNQVFGPNLVVGLFMLIGALIAVPPLSADMKWMSAQKTRDSSRFELILKPEYLNPQNSQKYLSTIELFEKSNLTDLSHKYALQAIQFNPDSFDTWRLFYQLRETNSEEKIRALENMKRLDPLNPNLKQGS